MILLFNAMQSSLSMVYDRETGAMRTLLVSPFPRSFLLLSKLFGGVFVAVLQSYTFLFIARLWDSWSWKKQDDWMGFVAAIPSNLHEIWVQFLNVDPAPMGFVTVLPALIVRESRRAAAIAAAAFHGEPASSLRFVGVTGTNGKTTTVDILRHLLDSPGAAAASIGTLGVLRGGAGEALPGGSGLTTPGPIELQRILRALVDAGVRWVAMEVSSHALHQQ